MYALSHLVTVQEQGQFDLYLFHAMIIYLIFYSFPQLAQLPNFIVLLTVFFATLFLAKLLMLVKKYLVKCLKLIYPLKERITL